MSTSFRRNRVGLVAAGLVTAVLFGPVAVSGGTTSLHTDSELEAAMARRTEIGLPSNADDLASWMRGTRDVGSPTWGIPMTSAESIEVDLAGRSRFADWVDTEILSVVRGHEAYAGAYVDQSRNGSVVIMFTNQQAVLAGDWAKRTPPGNRDVTVVTVPQSMKELESAADRAWAAWEQLGAAGALLRVGIDDASNGLQLEVEGLTNASVASDVMERSLGVPVHVREGMRGSDTHCTTRDHCHGPTYAGIRLYKGAIDSQHECALGFHIRIGTDERFVTSGHCGYSGSNNWLHPGLAGNHVLGAETAQTLYVNNGQDVMVVQEPDTEASDNIFASYPDITDIGSPIQSETLCVQLAETAVIKCAAVTSSSFQWISDTANPDIIVNGADLAISTIDGDSGSPVYRKVNDPNDTKAKAIGLAPSEQGEFAKLSTSLDDWGAVVFN